MSPTTTHKPGLRDAHSEQVLRLLLREGPLSRVDLARATGLTTAAISHITRELIEQRWLHEIGTARQGRVGAAAILLDFPLEEPLFGVIHQAVTTLSVGLCNLRGQVVARTILNTPHTYTPEWGVAQIVEQLHLLLHTQGRSEQALLGIGAGLSGLINSECGIVRRAASFGWENVHFRDLLAQHFSCPIAVENNVRGMAFGEALLGRGRSWENFVFVYLGIGIGAGIIIDHYPYRGTHDGAGEIGHITVEPEGEACACGNRGCLETILAEPAIARHAHQQGLLPDLTSQGPKQMVYALTQQAKAGESEAKTIIENCGEALGLALANLVDLLNPGHIVLHGTLTYAGELFFQAVSDCVQKRAFLTRDTIVEFVPPTFGENAGLVGAAAIALERLVLHSSSRLLIKPCLEEAR